MMIHDFPLEKDFLKDYAWGLEFVKNFYLRQPEPYIWKGDDATWKEIFQKIGLELGNSKNIVKRK